MASTGKPRVSKKYLAENCKGSDRLFRLPERRAVRGAERTASYGRGREGQRLQYQDIFGKGNFYLEIQDQGLEEERKIRADLFRLERELEIPLVATNDSHYLCGEDSHAHDVMLCVQTGAKIHDDEPLQIRQRPIFCQERRRDGAALQRFAAMY